jgi:hypothetical protein
VGNYHAINVVNFRTSTSTHRIPHSRASYAERKEELLMSLFLLTSFEAECSRMRAKNCPTVAWLFFPTPRGNKINQSFEPFHPGIKTSSVFYCDLELPRPRIQNMRARQATEREKKRERRKRYVRCVLTNSCAHLVVVREMIIIILSRGWLQGVAVIELNDN